MWKQLSNFSLASELIVNCVVFKNFFHFEKIQILKK